MSESLFRAADLCHEAPGGKYRTILPLADETEPKEKR